MAFDYTKLRRDVARGRAMTAQPATIALLPNPLHMSQTEFIEGIQEGLKDQLGTLAGTEIGQSITDSLSTLIASDKFAAADYTEAQFIADATGAASTAIFNHLKTIQDPQARLAVFEEAQTIAESLTDSNTSLTDLPYSSTITAGIKDIVTSDRFMEDGYTTTQFTQDATRVATNAFREHLQGLPAGERFAAFQELQTAASGIIGDAATAQMNTLITKLENAGPDIQNALMHAITNNEHFLDYIVDKAGEAGTGDNADFISSTLDQLFLKNEAGEILYGPDGKPLINEVVAGPIQDILNHIGNNPNVDHGRLLDSVADTSAAYADALTGGDPAKIQEAKEGMVDALRLAGAEINAFATMDMDMVWKFLEDLFSGRGAGFAINNMAQSLGLEGDQLAAFEGSFQPFAEFLNFMAKPGVEVWQNHKDEFRDAIAEAKNDLATISGANRVENYEEIFSKPATTGHRSPASVKESWLKVVETDHIDLNDPNAVLNAIAKAEPNLKDEVAAIKSNIILREQFHTSNNTTPEQLADRVEKVYENMNDGTQTLRQAVTGLTPAA